MIKATAVHDARRYSIRICGHAGYAQSGDDIVCAAVSTLVVTFGEYLETYCKDLSRIRLEPGDSEICVELTTDPLATDPAIRMLEVGLYAIARVFPEYFAFEKC